MIKATNKRTVLINGLICLFAAVLVGVVLGVAARSWKLGFSFLALPVGLAAGCTMLFRNVHRLPEACATAVLCAVGGLAVFAWTGYAPTWSVEQNFPENEINALAAKTLALRICHERKVPGVWGYEDVPEAIKDEAQQKIKSMSGGKKRALLNKTYARRINHDIQKPGGPGSYLPVAAWGLGAVVLAVAPVLVRSRFGGAHHRRFGGNAAG